MQDISTYDYYPDGDSTAENRGRLMRTTNALSQETNFKNYDLFGNVGSVVDANDVETTYLYDGRDRVTETRIVDPSPSGDIVTINQYDAVGRLHRVRLPNCVDAGMGCEFSAQYDYVTGVGWLREVRDALGNKIIYSYDTEGNRAREEFRNSSDVIVKFTNFRYDSFNRLQYVYYSSLDPCSNPPSCTIDTPGAIFSKFTYDGSDNRLADRDPEGHISSFTYDALNRLETATQTAEAADTLLTTYQYDRLDGVTSVTDPMGFETTYQNSDMTWRVRLISPDTGATTYIYDAAGNLTSSTNARSITTTRGYDALNRPISVSFPDPSLHITYSYDSTDSSFGVGRRTEMTDSSGRSSYHYDPRGLLTEEVKTIAGESYLTQYRYDKNGNRTKLFYPPYEREVTFTPDAADRIVGVSARVNGVTAPIATAIAYRPFGPRTSLTFDNDLVDSRVYDSRYRLGIWTLGSIPNYILSYDHVYNNDSNLTMRIDNIPAVPVADRTFGYDGAHRLTQALGPWGMFMTCPDDQSYTYDKNGNRSCKDESDVSPVTEYSHVDGTNRLDESTGGEATTYGHDASGNLVADGALTYNYNDANRLSSITPGSIAAYTYDGDGRRIVKAAGGTTTYYFYDPEGVLLTEIIPGSGAAMGKDYIYLDAAPLARIDWSATEESLEGGLQSILFVTKASPNVHLDWTSYQAGSNNYVVRRKLVTDPFEKTFDGNYVIANVQDPMREYDDPVLDDRNFYEYEIYKLVPSESLLFYHTDHLDTPIAMTNLSATPVWRMEYLPFGGGQPVGTVGNNLRFLGQYFDGETGLHQNIYRDYAPTLGRYHEPDPLQSHFSIYGGLYPYAADNPIHNFDPLGLICSPCCDTPEKRAAEKAAMRRAASTSLAPFLATHFIWKCGDLENRVTGAIGKLNPACHDLNTVESVEVNIAGLPKHVATALRPCDVDRWEDGFILDAWPSGILSEYSWSNWRPRFTRFTPRLLSIRSCEE